MRRTRRASRRRVIGAASRFRLRDLVSEAMAGLLQRPGRSALTMLGTVLGIGSFVAIVGLSQTATGQIGKQFNVLDATQVTVSDSGANQASKPTMDFPADADAIADRVHGVGSNAAGNAAAERVAFQLKSALQSGPAAA